jgi:hypothetical protein
MWTFLGETRQWEAGCSNLVVLSLLAPGLEALDGGHGLHEKRRRVTQTDMERDATVSAVHRECTERSERKLDLCIRSACLHGVCVKCAGTAVPLVGNAALAKQKLDFQPVIALTWRAVDSAELESVSDA